MYFSSQDTQITIKRDCYCLLSGDCILPTHEDRVEIMKVYWNYSDTDGWGSLSDDYVFVNDIPQMTQTLKAFEYGVTDRFVMELWGQYKNCPFISLHVWKEGVSYAASLKVYDGIFSEYISVSCRLTESEWKSCSDELMGWGNEFQLRLGDKVETLVHYDDNFFPLGRVGEVTKLHPDSDSIEVSFIDIGWDKKPYRNARLYGWDEVKRAAE